MSIETTICPRCDSTCVVHLPESIGFNQWICNQCSHQWDFAGPEERALVPKHLTGGRIERFLEEFLAIKVVIKGEAEKIWKSGANAYQATSIADNEDKPRVFAEQVDRLRDRLIGLQETLIIDRLQPLVAKYQVSSNEQIGCSRHVTKRGAQSPLDMWTGSCSRYGDNCTAPGLGRYLSGHGDYVACGGTLRIWM